MVKVDFTLQRVLLKFYKKAIGLEKISAITYKTEDLYLEHIKNSRFSDQKQKSFLKMVKYFGQTLHQRRYMDSK